MALPGAVLEADGPPDGAGAPGTGTDPQEDRMPPKRPKHLQDVTDTERDAARARGRALMAPPPSTATIDAAEDAAATLEAELREGVVDGVEPMTAQAAHQLAQNLKRDLLP